MSAAVLSLAHPSRRHALHRTRRGVRAGVAGGSVGAAAVRVGARDGRGAVVPDRGRVADAVVEDGRAAEHGAGHGHAVLREQGLELPVLLGEPLLVLADVGVDLLQAQDLVFEGLDVEFFALAVRATQTQPSQ